MHIPSLQRQSALATLIALVLSMAPLLPSIAQAADPSLPYRNYPGFQCFHTNSRGECTDFTYYNDGYNGGGTSIPPYIPPVTTPCAYPTTTYPYNNTNMYNNNYNYNTNYNSTYCPPYNNNYGRVTMTVTGTPSTVQMGGTINYTLIVRNTGAARSVDVHAFLDPNTSFVATSLGGVQRSSSYNNNYNSNNSYPYNNSTYYPYNNNEVDWLNLFMPTNGTQRLTLQVRVNGSASSLNNTIRLQADADGQQYTVSTNVTGYSNSPYPIYCYDRYGNPIYTTPYSNTRVYNNCYSYPNGYNNNNYNNCNTYPYNNSDPYNNGNCTNYGNGSFRVSLIDSPDPVEPGGIVNYTIVVSNDNTFDSTVDVFAVMDPNESFVSASDSGLSSFQTVRWQALTIPRLSSRTLTLRVNSNRSMLPGSSVSLQVTAGTGTANQSTRIGYPFIY